MKSNEEFMKGIYEKASSKLDATKNDNKKRLNWKRPALLLCASFTLIIGTCIYRNTLTSNQSPAPKVAQFSQERANMSGNNNFSTTTLPTEILVEGKLHDIQYTTTTCSFTLQVTYSPANIPSTIYLQINIDMLSSIYPDKLEENIPTSLLLSYSDGTFSVTSIVQ